ncbi:hypothetical protein G4B88_031362 [Cannabis sativa]|uniref:DUF4283 domain-containing protein n=1 Tax=Cannabis sativa TaxID=3483 RepID=A0A7J6GEE9_CANSA|nr:hypothetical protein G4B88_031362 [Cannabis sativa]
MAKASGESKDIEVEVIDEGMNQVLQRDSALEIEMLELFEDITLKDVVVNKACVGKVVGCKDMTASVVKKILLGVWRRLGPWRMKKCEDGVMEFFFDEEDDYAFVLEKRPWIVNGVLLNLKPWPVDGEVRVAEFEVASFWVQFHGLPTRFLKDENAAIMEKKVGSFVKTDGKPKEELTLTVEGGEHGGDQRRGGWGDAKEGLCSGRAFSSGREYLRDKGHVVPWPSFLQLPNPDFAHTENRDIIPNIGPTIAQSLEIPHEWICLSQKPHKFPDSTPLGWPNLDKEAQEMFLKLYGDDVINLYKAQQSLISNPPNLSEMILFLLGNTRKRKAHTWYEPYPTEALATPSNLPSEEPEQTKWTPSKEKFCIGSGMKH